MEEPKLINMILRDFRILGINILIILLNVIAFVIILFMINLFVFHYTEIRSVIKTDWIFIINSIIATLVFFFLSKTILKKIAINKKKSIFKTFSIARKVLIGLSFLSISIGIVYNTIKIINYKEPTEAERELIEAVKNIQTLDASKMDSTNKANIEKAAQKVFNERNKK